MYILYDCLPCSCFCKHFGFCMLLLRLCAVEMSIFIIIILSLLLLYIREAGVDIHDPNQALLQRREKKKKKKHSFTASRPKRRLQFRVLSVTPFVAFADILRGCVWPSPLADGHLLAVAEQRYGGGPAQQVQPPQHPLPRTPPHQDHPQLRGRRRGICCGL